MVPDIENKAQLKVLGMHYCIQLILIFFTFVFFTFFNK